MSEKMQTVLTKLRARVVALRSMRVDILGKNYLKLTPEAAARLMYLVPLYDAMHATVQQAGNAAGKGAQSYAKKFAALKQRIRNERSYNFYPSREKYFGDGLEELELLVPRDGISAGQWDTVRLFELINQVEQEVEAERQADVRKGFIARDALRAFLASQTDEQRALLAHAIQVGRGGFAVTIDKRDLEPK